MIFSSIEFFIFFALLIVTLLITKMKIFSKKIIRHVLLLIFSFVFYGWWDWRFCLLMLTLIIISYSSAILIEKNQNNKIYLITGVIAPLAALAYFKYFNFFISTFASVFRIEETLSLQIILPVGISFYTFQALSYVIDVFRKKLRAEKSFIKYALYISFFPQLVAGPIIRASSFLPQLDEERNISPKNFSIGIQIFVFGLFKKVVIADHLSVYVDEVFKAPAAFHAVSLILAIIAYSIQIYFDFSGYSDMAIGCAKCLGYDFTRNFNLPYISRNITEFWRRWHISLSSWLKDYLYIPLGGNRKGKARTYINNMLTMLLGGLWHGANWTFVIWGGIHGIALAVHKYYLTHRKSIPASNNADVPNNKRASKKIISHIVSILLTNIFVCFCWIFFRAENFSTAWLIIYRIVFFKTGIIHIYSWFIVALVILFSGTMVAVKYSIRNKMPDVNGFYPLLNLSKIPHLALFLIIVGIILGIAYTGSNPFIYFQF